MLGQKKNKLPNMRLINSAKKNMSDIETQYKKKCGWEKH